MRTQATLVRDCDAAEIPFGGVVRLTKDSVVTIMQSLGGAYTVITPNGYMVRIADTDADALGEEFAAQAAADRAAAAEQADGKSIEQMAWDALKTCYDPEIPVNMVDLGLVYSCEALPLDQNEPDAGKRVSVRFTLTAPGCGMGDYLKRDVESKLQRLPGVKETDVQVVFEPAWDQTRMSDAARLQLGLM